MTLIVLLMNKNPYKEKQGHNPGNGYGFQKNKKGKNQK